MNETLLPFVFLIISLDRVCDSEFKVKLDYVKLSIIVLNKVKSLCLSAYRASDLYSTLTVPT